MKLHLPSGLRAALLSCFALASALATPAVTTTVAGGVAAVTILCSATPAQAEAVTWDANWQLADAPTEIPDANVISNVPSGFTFLSAAGEPYMQGGQTVVRLADTVAGAEKVEVIGGAGATTNEVYEGEGPLVANTWLKVTGGTYATLAGGSYAQNYQSGPPSTFTGDSHILLTAEGGSSPTVDYIVGGNYMDGQNAAFTGNSYISVQAGTVNGSIVGGGTSAHIQTAVMNGNSHIWVYTPLSGMAAVRFSLPGNLIVGGNAAINNFAPRLEQTGDSAVTIDLSAYTPSGTPSMDKIIMGDAYLLPNTASTHTGTNGAGNAAVSIIGTAQGGSNITFSQPVVAGSWFAGSGTASLSGNTALTITGGSFAQSLVGGSYLASASATGVSSSIGGSTTLTLGGTLEAGSNAMVIGGSYVNAQEATVSSGAHTLTVNAGSYEADIIGGSWVAAGNGTVTQTTGNIALAVNGGNISGSIYGGSFTARDNAESVNEHGDISINLAGGSVLGNVYAGGGVAAGASGRVTAASTQVEVSNDVVLGSSTAPIIISGDVENGSTDAIAGNRTLVLSGSSAYTNLGNTIFHDFNIVNNAADATLILEELDSSFTKQGAGALSINGAESDLNPIGELTVEAGSLNTGTAWLTRNGAGLSAITLGARTSLTTDGLALADGAAVSLNLTDATGAMVTVGSAGGLRIGGQMTMNLTLTGVEGLAPGGQLTLMSWGNTEAEDPFNVNDVTWVNKGSEHEAYTLSIVNKTLVLSHAEELVWDGAEQGTWGADAGNWEGGSAASTDKAVTFGTPTGSSSTVSISGPVAPQSITVDNAADTTYTFEQEAGSNGAITGATALMKNNEGALVMSLENSYTGGTTINGGSVEAAAVGALGTGSVTLNGGELIVSAAEAVASNALALNGGSLSYEANETRVLDTAAITHAAGSVPTVSVAEGSLVTWQYTDAAAQQNAMGDGLQLSGGGTLRTEGQTAAGNVALSGNITLQDSGTTLEIGSMGSKQLGTADAPAAVSLAEGTTLRVDRPEADAPSTLNTQLTGSGTLEFANTSATANSTTQLAGDNSAFAGSINLGSADEAADVASDAAAVLLDYSQGSPVGGVASTLNLNGLGFATVLAGGTQTTTAAAVSVNRNTTQYAQTAGLNNVFTGAVSSAADATWTLDATTVDGGQTNTLAGDLAALEGTLASIGKEGSLARWQLGGEGAAAPSTLAATLSAENEYNEFVANYAAETTLSGQVTGQANLTQQGTGTLVLTGESDSSGTLRVAEGSTVQLGRADDAGSWGNVTSGATLAGAGTLRLVNGGLVGTLALEESPSVVVDVAANATVDLGGNDGSLISGAVTIAAGGTLTNVGSSILDRELALTLDAGNVGEGSAAATAMVQFVDDVTRRAARAVTASLGSTTEAIALDTSATGVVDLLRRHRVAGVESYLTLTNGSLVTAADYSNVSFGENMDILRDLGLRIDRVDGGSLVLSGAAQGVYIAGEGEDATSVAGYQNLGAYQAVAVLSGETLRLSLNGAPDAALDGEGATINNLLGAEGASFIVSNTDTSGEQAVVILNNSVQPVDPVPEGLPGSPLGADTTFSGDIREDAAGGAVEFIKTGAGTLTVGGIVEATQLTVREGSVALNGEGSDLDTLELAGGNVRLGTGRTDVDHLVDSAAGSRIDIAEGATLALAAESDLEASQIAGPGTLRVTGELGLADAARLNGVALELAGGSLGLEASSGNTVTSLSGNGSVEGIGTAESVGLSITSTGGSYAGALAGNGTLTVEQGAQQAFVPGFSGGAGWNLVNNGRMSLDFSSAASRNTPVALDTLTLGANSVTDMSLNTDAPAANMLTLRAIAAEQGARVNLSAPGADDIVTSDRRLTIGRVSGGQPAGTLLTLTPDMDNIVFMLLDAERSTLLVDEQGNLQLNLVTSRRNNLAPLAHNPNSAAGATLLWDGAFSGNTATGTDLRRLLEAFNSGSYGGDADRVLAAVAGSGVSVLSSALAADIERQLRGIRNRTTMMSGKRRVACKGALADDSPQYAAWIQAEGDHRKMDASGLLPGYSLTSWGGTLGMDVSCREELVAGLALTALYGDLDAHSADNASGDFDRYYISAFARLRQQRWQHTLLGTVGRLDGDLDRSISYGSGSYHTHANTKGWGYGLMYEIGYDLPVDEDARFTLQPVVNVSWRIADVDNFSESGSDAALHVGSQVYNVVTFGAGIRTRAEVGDWLFNRRALFEGRALVKVDAGDREGEATVAMLGGGGAWSRVRSEKLGAVGVELGAGFSIPLGEEAGAFFIDGSAELRNSYSNLNGTLGYRFEF